MRAHSPAHRHRRDSELHAGASHYDPGWRWNRRTPAAPSSSSPLLISPRHESHRRSSSEFDGLVSPLDETTTTPAGGEGASGGYTTPSRLRTTTPGVGAAYGAPSSYASTPKPLTPPNLSGHSPSRSSGSSVATLYDTLYGGGGGGSSARSGRFASRSGRLGYTPPVSTSNPPTPMPNWSGMETTYVEDSAATILSSRQLEIRGGGGGVSARTVSPLPVRRAGGAASTVAGTPLRTRTLLDAAATTTTVPSLPATPPPPAFLIPPPQPQDVGKLVVVLDLDETLVYSRDITLYERPGVMQLLKTLKGRCELIVWTAGTREYALDVIRVIDTVCAVQHCIYRHPMWWTGDAGCTKELRLLGRPMDRVILVDNTPSVFRANPRNSLLVSDFIVPFPRLYNAQEKVLSTLTDIFEHVFRRFTQPCTADVLASKRIRRQLFHLERGGTVELNVLVASSRSVDTAWDAAARALHTRYSA